MTPAKGDILANGNNTIFRFNGRTLCMSSASPASKATEASEDGGLALSQTFCAAWSAPPQTLEFTIVRS